MDSEGIIRFVHGVSAICRKSPLLVLFLLMVASFVYSLIMGYNIFWSGMTSLLVLLLALGELFSEKLNKMQPIQRGIIEILFGAVVGVTIALIFKVVETILPILFLAQYIAVGISITLLIATFYTIFHRVIHSKKKGLLEISELIVIGIAVPLAVAYLTKGILDGNMNVENAIETIIIIGGTALSLIILLIIAQTILKFMGMDEQEKRLKKMYENE